MRTATMNRLTDHDHKCGPITIARWRGTTRIEWSSGDDDDPGNRLLIVLFGWAFRMALPNILRPFRIKHDANWDEATVARLGRDWYYETHERQFGFAYGEGFLQVFHGAQTHDSLTDQTWCKHLPWTQWTHVRRSYYDASGAHFWTEVKGDWLEQMAKADSCPTVAFEFDDYDGKRIKATTRIEELEWRFGEGWFRWLSWFRKPKVRRSLDIRFSEEVGPEKGSWKGGIVGHGIDMLPGELHRDAFIRYCDKEHTAKGRRYRIKFIDAE